MPDPFQVTVTVICTLSICFWTHSLGLCILVCLIHCSVKARFGLSASEDLCFHRTSCKWWPSIFTVLSRPRWKHDQGGGSFSNFSQEEYSHFPRDAEVHITKRSLKNQHFIRQPHVRNWRATQQRWLVTCQTDWWGRPIKKIKKSYTPGKSDRCVGENLWYKLWENNSHKLSASLLLQMVGTAFNKMVHPALKRCLWEVCAPTDEVTNHKFSPFGWQLMVIFHQQVSAEVTEWTSQPKPATTAKTIKINIYIYGYCCRERSKTRVIIKSASEVLWFLSAHTVRARLTPLVLARFAEWSCEHISSL